MDRMTKSGLPEEQAEAVDEAFREQVIDLVTQDCLESALNAQLIKIATIQIAVALLLFVALKYFGV